MKQAAEKVDYKTERELCDLRERVRELESHIESMQNNRFKRARLRAMTALKEYKILKKIKNRWV